MLIGERNKADIAVAYGAKADTAAALAKQNDKSLTRWQNTLNGMTNQEFHDD
jgi:hypothetical protein